MPQSTTVGVLRALAYGLGFLDRQRPANPAAGSGLTITVPGGESWRVLSLVYTLTTSAVAANRSPELRVLDGDGNVTAAYPMGATQTATLTTINTFALGATSQASGAASNKACGIGEIFIPAGYKLQVFVGSQDAGDTVTNIELHIERYPDGPSGYQRGVVDYTDAPAY